MTFCCTVFFKNAVKIDFVKMQKQQYTQSPNKAKLYVLLFTSSTKACTIAHNNITSASQHFKKIQETTFILLEIT